MAKRKAPPTLTSAEIMQQEDAKHLLTLLQDLIVYMPPPFKAQLEAKGYLEVGVPKYRIQIVDRKRFT